MTRSRSPLLNNNGLLQEEDIMNRETSFFPSEKIFPSHCSSKRLNDLLLKSPYEDSYGLYMLLRLLFVCFSFWYVSLKAVFFSINALVSFYLCHLFSNYSGIVPQTQITQELRVTSWVSLQSSNTLFVHWLRAEFVTLSYYQWPLVTFLERWPQQAQALPFLVS